MSMQARLLSPVKEIAEKMRSRRAEIRDHNTVTRSRGSDMRASPPYGSDSDS